MPQPIPTPILLERERANSFRRHVQILHERCTDTIQFSDLRMSQTWIEEFAWYKAGRLQYDTPLMMIEWALEWANSVPPPPIGVLREARALLQAAADDWASSFQLCRDVTSKFLIRDKPSLPDWLAETIRIATSEQKRLEVILRENWPGGTLEEEDRLLREMRAGTAIALDDAFALIAGVSGEEWERKVQAHKKKARTP